MDNTEHGLHTVEYYKWMQGLSNVTRAPSPFQGSKLYLSVLGDKMSKRFVEFQSTASPFSFSRLVRFEHKARDGKQNVGYASLLQEDRIINIARSWEKGASHFEGCHEKRNRNGTLVGENRLAISAPYARRERNSRV